MPNTVILTVIVLTYLSLSACSLNEVDVESAGPMMKTEQVPTPTNVQGVSPMSAYETSRPPIHTTTGENLSTATVVKMLTPSVAHITTEVSLMGQFNQPFPQQGVGTGVILDTDGHILTNSHVVAQLADEIIVTLHNGESFPAVLIGQDPATDTAVIQIDARELHPAQLGDSSMLQVGEDVIAIGHALGLRGGPTVSKGVVSALGRSIDAGQFSLVDLIQTDASINPGNSGGPLVNSKAEVIGINTAIFQGSEGIGFSININDAQVVALQLINNGFVNRGYLGIIPVNFSPALVAQFRIPAPKELLNGVIVAQITKRGAAADANIQELDIIVKLDGEPISNTGELSKFLIAHPPESTVKITFFRGKEQMMATLKLGERPRP